MSARFTDEVTKRINKFIPTSAVDLKIEDTNISYLHPTKGWRSVSFKRIGIQKEISK